MRFDTLDKKPKLFNIAIASGIFVLLAAILFLTRPAGWVQILSVSLVVYIAVDIFFLVRAFFRQLRYNPYSYNTIYYFGFTVYLITVFVTFLITTIQCFTLPQRQLGIQAIATLTSAPAIYILITSPFILALSIALVISNISLLRHEGRRIVNFLGILFALLLTGGAVALFLGNLYFSGSFSEVVIHDIVISSLMSLYLYVESMLLGAIVANIISVKHWPAPDKDYIIILGCAIRKDGTPTPLLKGRIDRAIAFYKYQLEKTGKAATFITSGGQGSDECISESACMNNYLLEQGIPAERIIEEDQSTSTFENMRNSKEIIFADDPGSKMIYSTTNYHVFRSGIMARRVKMRAQGIGAKTKWYFWPNAAVREFAGMLSQHRGKQILIVLVTVAIYVLLSVAQLNLFL